MTQTRTIVFVHGKSGQERIERWLAPLNSGLTSLGYPTLDASHDRIVNPEYLGAMLSGQPGEEPPTTWERPPDADQRQSWADLLVRREAFADAIEGVRNDPSDLRLHLLADTFVPDLVAGSMQAVAQYRDSAEHRRAAWRALLASMPQSGHVVIIAHSLGSIVMLDILKRMPPGLVVDLLVTIGSPMGVPSLRARHDGLDDPDRFPAQRVRAWVNFYDAGDVVTVGRGASSFFAAALDAPVHIDSSHSLVGYLSHPALAAAVGLALFGPRQEDSAANVPARALDQRWNPLLLQFAYSQELVSSCDTGKWGFRRELDTARRVLAERATTNTVNKYHELLWRAEALQGQGDPWDAQQVMAGPLSPERAPDRNDLLLHAGSLVSGQLTDDRLVVVCVSLLLSPVLPPFDIDVDSDHHRLALTALLHRIRRPSTDLTSADYAAAVIDAVDEAKGEMSASGFPWGKVLIGTGIGLLAATGIGLAAAVPVGLAGAALITSTLATFGPGGMAGGIATLAALTGAASAFTGLGVAVELTSGSSGTDQLRRFRAEQLADLSSADLRVIVTSIVAVLSTQQRLGLTSMASSTEALLLETQAIVLRDKALHDDIAPGRPGTKDWARKEQVLNRALSWLAGHGAELGLPALERSAVVLEIETAPPAAD